MRNPIRGLLEAADEFSPRNLKRLADAGALDRKTPVALARTLPWLVGRGRSLGILLQAHAAAIPAKTAIHDHRGSLTWKELDERANRAAHLLWSAGCNPGDSVGLVLRNGRELAEILLGAQKLGIVASPFNTWAKPKELKATLQGADPSLLIYDVAHAGQVREAASERLPRMHVGDDGEPVVGSAPYETLLHEQPASPPNPFTRNRGSARVVIHTSGTTGTPKGAARDASAAGLGAMANLLSVVPYRRDDVIFCPAPMFHSFGLATFTFATTLGATLVLPERFDPEASLELIERHRATAASFVPVMLRRIVTLDERVKSRYDVSSVHIIVASGSVLSEDLRRETTKLFGNVLYDLYGSTEIGWVAIATPDDMAARPKTVGRPVPGIEVAVFGDDGTRLGPDEKGELHVKSKILFEGYTSGETKPERDGFMSIGDVGRVDRDGYVYVESRTDDMVVVGGENVYPIEVEQVIEDVPGVREVAVLGIDDEEYGEVLAAFVVGSASERDVLDACRAQLASYKVPKRVRIVDTLPRTSTGKVLKRELVADLPSAERLEK